MRIDLGLLVLRVCAGGMMFIFHGWDKIIHYSDKVAGFPDPIGVGKNVSLALAAFSEGICAVLVVIGLLTRPAAAFVLITMLVAGLVFHASDPWSAKELAILYAACFGTLLFTGPGDIAFDRFVRFRKKSIFS